MKRQLAKRATKDERAFIRDLRRTSAFDLVDRGRARILRSDEYPEPLTRFLDRERNMIHVPLSPATRRKLEIRSRRTGIPVDELARHWIVQGMRRDAG